MTEQITVSIREAADAIGLSPWTVRKMVKNGKLPSVRINRRVLIETTALRELIDKSRRA